MTFAIKANGNTAVLFSYSTPEIDTFSAKRLARFSQIEVKLGTVKKGDLLDIEIRQIKGGKLKEMVILVGEQVIYAQSGIKKDLKFKGLTMPAAGACKILFSNRGKLFSRRFDLLVGHHSPPDEQLLDPNRDLADLLDPIAKTRMKSGTVIRGDSIFFSPSAPEDTNAVEELTILTPPRLWSLCRVQHVKIPALSARNFQLGEIVPGDTVLVTITDLKGGKLTELALTSDNKLLHSKGKVSADLIKRSKPAYQFSNIADQPAQYTLQISNRGHLCARHISLQVEKITAPKFEHYQTDTLALVDCIEPRKLCRDTFIEFFSREIVLSNLLNIEEAHGVHLEIAVPDSLVQQRNIITWLYRVLPLNSGSEANKPPFELSQIKDPYPAIRDNLCYTVSTGTRTIQKLLSSDGRCASYDHFYGKTEKLRVADTGPATIHFYFENLNRNVVMKADLKLYLQESIVEKKTQQCPVLQFVPLNKVLP